jgi:hypothetical protein
MIEDNVGYQFSNNSGSTPAAGIVNSISFTQDDWQMETIVNNGGGTYWGCCPISNLHFLDSDVGLRSEGYQGVYSFQQTIDGGVNWSNLPGSMVFRPTDVCLINDSVAYVAGGTLLKNKFILSITEEENHEQSFLVSPNPAHQTIVISMLNNSIIDDVYIYDQIGSLVYSGKKSQIDISNLVSGIYFILIKSGDQYLYSKFIKN